jgi:hypothetical protein
MSKEKEGIRVTTLRLPDALMTRLQVHKGKSGKRLNDILTAAVRQYLKENA